MSAKLGRPFGCWQLDADDQLWLSEMWHDPTVSNPAIAEAVGLSKTGLYRYKVRLGLPSRCGTVTRQTQNLVVENKKRRRDKDPDWRERCEKIEAADRLANTPRWKRCDFCGGREDTRAKPGEMGHHAHGAAA